MMARAIIALILILPASADDRTARTINSGYHTDRGAAHLFATGADASEGVKLPPFPVGAPIPEPEWSEAGTRRQLAEGDMTKTTYSSGMNVYAYDLQSYYDIDSDGDNDIVSASYSTYNGYAVTWYENLDGAGTSWTERQLSSITGHYGVSAGDIDGDGDGDIVTASYTGSTVYWHENLDGSGTSWSDHRIDSGEYSNYIGSTVGDLDSDGDMDVIVSAYGSRYIAWFENMDGSGGSWSRHQVAYANYPRAVQMADLDGDGDYDIVSADSSDSSITFHENLDGSGTSWSSYDVTSSSDCNYAISVSVSYIDSDGDQDVVGACHSGHYTKWFENMDGSGTSWSTHSVGYYQYPWTTHSADIDNDGDIDIVSSYYYGYIIWYENSDGTGGSWTEHYLDDVGYGMSALAVDLDGNNWLDIVAAGVTDNYFTVWIQETGPTLEPTNGVPPENTTAPSMYPTMAPTLDPSTSLVPSPSPSPIPTLKLPTEVPSPAPTTSRLPSPPPTVAPTPAPTVVSNFQMVQNPSRRDFNLGIVVPKAIPSEYEDDVRQALKSFYADL